MKLLDTYDDKIYTLQALQNDYIDFRKDDPWNHAENFRAELYGILMAAINGRNDFNIIGPTPAEISRIIMKLSEVANK